MMKWMTVALALVTVGTSASAAQQETSANTAQQGASASAAPQAAPVNGSSVIPAPPAGKGQIVFFRKGGLMGAAISCAVHESGAKLTSLPPGKFAIVTADPGIHEFVVKSEAKDTLRLEIEAGETYYAQCSIGMGFMAGRPNLAPSDTAAFNKMSAKLKPVTPKPEA